MNFSMLGLRVVDTNETAELQNKDGLILTHVEGHTFKRVILFLESEDELKRSPSF
jgi:hypothetical protein